MLQRGHTVQIEVEYQYSCSCDDTNVCVSYCELQCQDQQSNYICICTVGSIGYKYRQRLTVDVRTYGETKTSRLLAYVELATRFARAAATQAWAKFHTQIMIMSQISAVYKHHSCMIFT